MVGSLYKIKMVKKHSRDGNFKLGDDGILTDIHDRVVLGDNGPIFLPVPLDNLNIAADGTLSMRQLGAPANVIEEVGRLKLVSPNYADMERGNDGLFRMEDGSIAPANANVKVMSGMLEGSNVNAVDEMLDMISLHVTTSFKSNMKQAEKLIKVAMRCYAFCKRILSSLPHEQRRRLMAHPALWISKTGQTPHRLVWQWYLTT